MTSRTLAALAAALWAAAIPAQQIPAQQAGHPEVEPGPSPAGTSAAPEGEGDAAAPAGPADKPRPSIIAPLAKSSILLGIGAAGTRVVVVGDRGHILVSEDGRHWKQVEVPVDDMLNRVRFRDDSTGWAVGHDASIVVTHDGGLTWQLQHFDPKGRPLYDVLFLGGSNLVAIGGYGTYLASGDDGAHWEQRNLPITDIGQHLNAATHLADGSLLIAGERGLLARSRDNGASWDLLDSPYIGSFFGVLPFGAHGALVFGLRGHVYVSDDVAACPKIDPTTYDPYSRETVTDAAKLKRLGWRQIDVPTGESLFGGLLDGDAAVLVGVNAVVVRVDPAQGTATRLRTNAGDDLSAVLRQGDRWIAVGRRGVQPLGDIRPMGDNR